MKMQSEDFVDLMTVVTSAFCSHMPCGLGKAGRQSPMPLAPLLPELFPGQPSTGCSSSPSLLCCHLLPRSLCGSTSNRWSIRNKEKLLEWNYLARLPAGQSLHSSWPSSSRQYPIQQFSQMVCLRAFWAPEGYWRDYLGSLIPRAGQKKALST